MKEQGDFFSSCVPVSVKRSDLDKGADENVDADQVRTERPVKSEQSIAQLILPNVCHTIGHAQPLQHGVPEVNVYVLALCEQIDPQMIPQGEGGEQGDALMLLMFALGHSALDAVISRLQEGERLFAF